MYICVCVCVLNSNYLFGFNEQSGIRPREEGGHPPKLPNPNPVHKKKENKQRLKVLCDPKLFSGRFPYSKYTNYFGAANRDERRFQFRPVNRFVSSYFGFHG